MKRFYLFIFLYIFSANAHALVDKNPFYDAIKSNSFGLVESLIASGEDINVQDQSGKTSLMYACQTSSPDVVKFLIEKGADVNIQTLSNVTALHYASRSKNTEILKLLLSNGAKVDVQDFSGFTPLMRAVVNKNLATFELLLRAGSNPFIENKNSKDSVDLVVKNSNVEMFELLVNPLSVSHRADLVLFQQKVEASKDVALQKVLDDKSAQIANNVSKLIAAFGNNARSVKAGPFTKFSDLHNFPCYEAINIGAEGSNCITVTDELDDRARKQNVEADVSFTDASFETLADVSVSVGLEAGVEDVVVLPEVVESDLGVMPVAVVESAAPVAKAVNQSSYSGAAMVSFSFNTAKVPAGKAFYEKILTENTLSYDQVKKNYDELNYLSSQEWAYGEDVPTNIISYNLLASYYGNKFESKPSYQEDEAYLKAQEALKKKNRLLAVTPIIKQSDKMKEAGFYIQSGSFIYPKNSTNLKRSLGKYGNVFIVEKLVRKRNFHVVYVGPFKTKKSAIAASQKKDFQKIIGVESFIRHF